MSEREGEREKDGEEEVEGNGDEDGTEGEGTKGGGLRERERKGVRLRETRDRNWNPGGTAPYRRPSSDMPSRSQGRCAYRGGRGACRRGRG